MYYVIPDVFKDGIRSCSPGPIVKGKYYFVLDSRDLVVEKIDGSVINAYYFDLKSELINVGYSPTYMITQYFILCGLRDYMGFTNLLESYSYLGRPVMPDIPMSFYGDSIVFSAVGQTSVELKIFGKNYLFGIDGRCLYCQFNDQRRIVAEFSDMMADISLDLAYSYKWHSYYIVRFKIEDNFLGSQADLGFFGVFSDTGEFLSLNYDTVRHGKSVDLKYSDARFITTRLLL